MPVPEKDTADAVHVPVENVPLMMTIWLLAPCGRDVGLIEAMVGASGHREAAGPGGPAAVGVADGDVRAPVAAPVAIDRFTVRCVESVRVTELTVIPPTENVTSLGDHVPLRKFGAGDHDVLVACALPAMAGLSEVTRAPP